MGETPNPIPPKPEARARRLAVLTTSALAFVTSVVSFIRLAQGDLGLVVTVCSVTAAAYMWLMALYVRVRRIDSTGHAYHNRVRLLALAALFVIPSFLVGGFLGWRYLQQPKSNTIVVVVADFTGPDSDRYRVTEAILRELRDAANNDPMISIVPMRESVSEQQGTAEAIKKGKELHANIVIWGYYLRTQEKAAIYAHFELLRAPKRFSFPKNAQEGKSRSPLSADDTREAPVTELDSLSLQSRFSGETRALVVLMAATSRLELKDYDGVISRMNGLLSRYSFVGDSEVIDIAALYSCQAAAFIGKGDFRSAVASYTDALDHRVDPESYRGRGDAYQQLFEWKNSIDDYSQALALRPSDFSSYRSRGISYDQIDDLAAALRDFNSAISLNPRDPVVYNNRGIVYREQGDITASVRDYDKAISLDPRFAEAYYSRGWALNKNREWNQALSDFTHAIALQRNYYEALVGRGLTNERLGNNKLAVEDYDRAISIAPKQYLPYYDRGVVYSEQGNDATAIADFTTSINLNPGYMPAYMNRGALYFKAGQFDAAISDFTKATELAPRFKYAETYLAKAYAQKGNYSKLASCYQHLVEEVEDSDYRPYNDLAWLFSTSSNPNVRDPRKGLRLAQIARSMTGNDPEVMDTYAAALAAAGQYETAVEMEYEAIALLGHKPENARIERFKERLHKYSRHESLSVTP